MDWEKYQLILFNMIQNAVKYNKKKGVIIIQLNYWAKESDVIGYQMMKMKSASIDEDSNKAKDVY